MGSKDMKWLKIIHVFLVVVFFGGILSSIVLNLHIDFTKYDESYLGYKNMMILSDYIVRLGAVGTLLIGFVYGFFTNWGFLSIDGLALNLFYISSKQSSVFLLLTN